MAHPKEWRISSECHVDNGVFHYESTECRFQIRLEDIVLVGEYTTPDGPGADDYFLVFFTRDGSRNDASFYAEGRDVALAALRDYWQAPLELHLTASDALASNILWPTSHAGQALFEFRRRAAAGFMGRVRERIGFVAIEQVLSPVAQELLAGSVTDIEAMLDEARREFDHDPLRALAITEFAIQRSSSLPGDDVLHARVQGRAWKEHGNALFMTGRLDDALAAATKAQEIFSNHAGLAGDRAAAMLLMALVASELGNRSRALSLLDECAAVFEAQGQRAKELMVLEIRAITLFGLERFEDALATLQPARHEAEELRLEDEIARIDLNMARCLIELGRLQEAKRNLERAEKSFAALGMQTEVLRARWCRADLMKKSGRREEALLELERLQPEFERQGMSKEGVEKDIANLKGAA